MAGTATNQNKNRNTNRPTTRARSTAAPENFPLLMRLPTIDFSGRAGELAATPVSETSQIPPVVESTLAAESTATESMGTHATPSISFEKSLETSAQPQSDPVARTSSPAGRSWWEHWSSGIVLILLIIALVTASILALNDDGNPDPELLASEESTDIPDIVIPELPKAVAPTLQQSTASESNSNSQPTLGFSASSNSSTIASPTPIAGQINGIQDAKASGQRADVETLVLEEPSDTQPSSSDASQEATSLIPDSLQFSHTEKAANNSEEETEVPSLSFDSQNVAINGQSAPQASLAAPVAVPSTPLFPELPLSNDRSAALPTSGQTSSSTVATPSTRSANGSSPSLYDGAKTNMESSAVTPQLSMDLPGLTNVGGGAATNSSTPVDTQMPSYAALLASAPAGATPASTSGFSLPSKSPQVTSSGAEDKPTAPAAEPSVRTTATPEMQSDELIKIWQEWRAKSTAVPTNRYPPPGLIPPTTNR